MPGWLVSRLEGRETHTHGFEAVLQDAYNCSETFSIPEEYRELYSTQELDLLKR